MSTSFLYHGFGLVGYDYVRTRYAGGAVMFSIKHDDLVKSIQGCHTGGGRYP